MLDEDPAPGLLIPPDSSFVGAGADDIRQPVAVNVVDPHLGAGFAEIGFHELPRSSGIGGHDVIAVDGQDLVLAVSVNVANAETMGVALGARALEFADVMALPLGMRVGGWFEPG